MGEARFDTEIKLKFEIKTQTKPNRSKMILKCFKVDEQMDKRGDKQPLKEILTKS